MIGSPVVTALAMQKEEKMAFDKGALASNYMDNVARGLLKAVLEEMPFSVTIVVGKGNNGGDGAALAHLLLEEGLDVDLVCVFPKQEGSELLQKHIETFSKKKPPIFIEDPADYELHAEVIIDALLGTGFTDKPHGKMSEAIKMINRAKRRSIPIWSIDIPSGIDGTLGLSGDSTSTVKADRTYFLGAAKAGVFLGRAFNYVGDLRRIDFGLEINKKTSHRLLEVRDVISVLPEISRDRNKFDAGGVVGVVNSLEMSGAASLSSLGAFRAGAGYVRLCVPRGSCSHTSKEVCEAASLGVRFPLEAVKVPYDVMRPRLAKEIIEASFKMKAAFIGPGFSTDKKGGVLLKTLLKNLRLPLVLDGGALYHLAKGRLVIPKGSILTPHLGELARFFDIDDFPGEKTFKKCQEFVDKHEVTLVVKGAPTFIFHPKKPILISPFGSPGMAVAGSGDVLTGIIAAQRAAGLDSREAAALGVCLHGLAGEEAALRLGPYSMMASDIMQSLPDVFMQLI